MIICQFKDRNQQNGLVKKHLFLIVLYFDDLYEKYDL